jgi:hypothetical protein
MRDPFQELLNELGPVFNLSLHLDKNNACAIQIDKHSIVQLQLDTSQENLFLFMKLTEIPPGKFRENVLQEALIANNSPDPLPGIFAYLAASNHLILFQRYPLTILNGKRLANLFGAFLELGDTWRKAIESGRPKPLPK